MNNMSGEPVSQDMSREQVNQDVNREPNGQEQGTNISRCGRRSRKRRNYSVKGRPRVCDQDREMVALRQWMKKTADFKCSLIPATFHDTGRGLMTRKSILAGDTIITLPRSLLITTETVLDSHTGEHVKNWVPKLTPQEAISVFIIWENSRTCLSPWQPYLSSLPKSFTTPVYFSERELSFLPVSVYSKCMTEINKIKQSYRKIFEYSQIRWIDFYQVLSYEMFIWAWYVINSRSVYYKGTRCEFLSGEEADCLALAPYLDLLNHSTNANVSASYNEASDCYQIRTFDCYQKYHQVFISYGEHDSQKLFIEYGFCIPDNPNDVYDFSYDDLMELCKEFSVQYTERKLQILRENKCLQSLTCSVEGVSWKLWTALKTLSMTWNQMQNWSNICIVGHDEAGLVTTATSMARFLINRALIQNQEGMKRIEKVEHENLHTEHLRIARTLTELEGNILQKSLSLLR